MRALTSFLFCGALVFLLTPLRAAEQCPDVRATLVDVRVEDTDSGRKCGFGFSLFGFSASIGGGFCPSFRVTYPAHQECLGQESPGNRCVAAGNMPVTSQACECSLFGVFGTGLAMPGCDCGGPTMIAGHVEDFETVPCREPL